MAAGKDVGAGFLVEDFITSITTQLDRVQDALRIKAVNRPLTYALKEMHLELKVFVEMDPSGQVLVRASGPNEAGASTLAMDFTTITKPMIEENTITLAATRSTPLDSLGLKPEEQQRLERLGVSNLAQLDRLGGSTGVSTVARMADVPVERLRRALQAGRPRLGTPAPRPVPSAPPPRPAPPVQASPPPRPVAAPPRPTPTLPGTHTRVPLPDRLGRTKPRRPLAQAATIDPLAWDDADAPALAHGFLEVPPASRHLTLGGSNLLHEDYPPEVRLNGEALEIEELDADRLVVRLPEAFAEGALEVSLGDQAPWHFALVHGPQPAPRAQAAADPWAPLGYGEADTDEA